MDSVTAKFYSGTSGLLVPIPKRDFPPEHQDKSRLAFYATLFNSLEINSSFYKLPRAVTVSKWTAEVHDNFTFTYKLWKQITHNKELYFNPADVKDFMDAINNVDNHKGSLLIQLPPSNTVTNAMQLNNLLTIIGEVNNGWKPAIEFRHPSWYRDDVYELLEKHQTSLVIHDMPASATPLQALTDNDVVYLRFHGPGGRYRGSYEDDVLYEYALYIKEWLEDGKTVYTYFNNTAGDALNNLITLNKYVSQ
jgi:uncharacterized protein YecE (DUF72 family)